MERYLRLGLQLGRHVDGVVDAYYGPAELAAAVESEPPVEPRMLVAASGPLLDELEDGWLRDQVVGLRTYDGVLADGSISYADEVEGCYGVRPTYTDEVVFTAAHLDLAHALAVRRALQPCRWTEVNAALLLHDRGVSEAEVRAYLERCGLMSPELAAANRLD